MLSAERNPEFEYWQHTSCYHFSIIGFFIDLR